MRNPRSFLGFLLFFVFIFSLPLLSFGQFKFRDDTFHMGVQGTHNFGGHGAAWWWVDDDFKLDLYVKNVGGRIPNIANNLFINYRNRFVDEANMRGVDDIYSEGTHGAEFANCYLFSTTTPGESNIGYNHLYQNDGKGFFQDISYMLYQEQSSAPRGVAALRFGKHLGFFTSNALPYPLPFINYLLSPIEVKNFFIFNGEQYVNEARGIPFTGFVQGVACADMDGKNGQDIIEAKWYPSTTIYLNDGDNYFYDAGKDLGLSQTLGVYDNGPSPGDINNDAKMDLAVAGDGRVIIYRNTGTFLRVHQVLRPHSGRAGFDVRFWDFNHDGWLDIFWNGVGFYENYEKNGERFFRGVTNVPGTERVLKMKDPRGSAVGDRDGDGDGDVYATDKKDYNVLLINEINNSDWIQVVVLRDDAGLFGGLGVKVYLYEAGHLGQKEFLRGYREMMGEYGYLGQDMPVAHFGAPSKGGARYDLRIVFVDGTIKDIKNIKPGQRIYVEYGRLLTIELSENGMTDPPPGTHVYEEGEVVTVKAFANPYYSFCCWTVGRMKVYDNPITITMDTDIVIKPNFKLINPPANFTVERAVNKTLFYREHMNILRWEPDPDNANFLNVTGYRIYQLQDSEKHPLLYLYEARSDEFEYFHRHVDLKKEYRYAITALTDEGGEGMPAYVTVQAEGQSSVKSAEGK
jgi:hypothetical protein